MRQLISLIIFLMLTNCGKAEKNFHATIGTWCFCDSAGNYNEYKITRDYVLSMSSDDENVWLLKNKFKDNLLIWSTWKLENNSDLLGDTLTLKPIFQSENKLTLVARQPWSIDTIKLNKKDIFIENIDFTNFDSWKKKILTEFKKRAELKSCSDIRI
ncbi:hypothetical protein [Gaetbulibacter aestuarii]|uniref:Lipoprotein n=1 Tax=Gaetbulibacter aestuarii TaxID=1502358 RepID=A0ABW7MUB8_9FLAO